MIYLWYTSIYTQYVLQSTLYYVYYCWTHYYYSQCVARIIPVTIRYTQDTYYCWKNTFAAVPGVYQYNVATSSWPPSFPPPRKKKLGRRALHPRGPCVRITSRIDNLSCMTLYPRVLRDYWYILSYTPCTWCIETLTLQYAAQSPESRRVFWELQDDKLAAWLYFILFFFFAHHIHYLRPSSSLSPSNS